MRFADIVGHRRLLSLLSGAVVRESLPPTLMFVGPSGVGKWRTALATAAALNCLEAARQLSAELPIDACGTCRSCDRIARGVHVDLVALEPDDRGLIDVGTVRDGLLQVGYRPFEGRRRLVLIRDADKLLPPSQSALLKSLEEPPPATVFVLVTSSPNVLLPTVRSRCMRLRFGRLTETELRTVLVRDHGLTDETALAAAALAQGSVSQALAVVNVDATAQRALAIQLLKQLARSRDVQTKLQAAASLHGVGKQERSREELSVVLRLISSMLRDIEAIKSGAEPKLLANPSAAVDLAGLASAFTDTRARDAFSAIERALEALGPGRNAGIKVVAEWLAVQL